MPAIPQGSRSLGHGRVGPQGGKSDLAWRPLRTRPALPRLFLLGAVVLAATLASCGTSASSNGTKACAYVNRSLAIISKSHSSEAESRALELLRLALPYAAVAAGSNGQWQPLEATLSETNRVKVTTLEPALSAECAAGNQGNVYGGGTFTQASIPPPTTSGP